jgi:RNA polymerase sigma-70 factor (ECF subfamily)
LYRIAVNVSLNRVSVKAPVTEPIDDYQFVDVGHDSPAERLLKEERGARVRDAIAQLPPKQRATLIMRMYQDMSHQEIADALGSSVGAVKANFFHALGNLKRILGQ